MHYSQWEKGGFLPEFQHIGMGDMYNLKESPQWFWYVSIEGYGSFPVENHWSIPYVSQWNVCCFKNIFYYLNSHDSSLYINGNTLGKSQWVYYFLRFFPAHNSCLCVLHTECWEILKWLLVLLVNCKNKIKYYSLK